VEVGPAQFYDPSVFTDYPPGYLYVLWLLGALFDGELLRLAVKAASIPADVAIAVGAAMLVWRRGGRGNAVAATAGWMLSPAQIIALVRTASETYPSTSLYAFNVWSVVADFWKPDDEYVAMGGALFVLGFLLSCLPLWRRRDVASLLFAGACAAFAFYFLPTRAHERYIFPAFALLLPFAATRVRVLWPYLALALTFAVTLYYAFTRYPQHDLRAAQ